MVCVQRDRAAGRTEEVCASWSANAHDLLQRSSTSATFDATLLMHNGDDNDALAAVEAAELVWGELTSEILSHLDAVSLACAASTCKGFHSSLEHAVKARVARSGQLLFDQPRMHEGACYMWRTWAEPGGGCSCAWQLRQLARWVLFTAMV